MIHTFICPEFEPTAMEKVMEILNTGQTQLQEDDATLYKDICFIFKTLEIDINLTEPGIWNPMFKHQGVDLYIEQEGEQTPAQIFSSTTTWSSSGTGSSGSLTTSEEAETSSYTLITKTPTLSCSNRTSMSQEQTNEMDIKNYEHKVNIATESYTSTSIVSIKNSFRNFLCRICDKGFQFSISLDKHMKRHIATKNTKKYDSDLQTFNKCVPTYLSATPKGQKADKTTKIAIQCHICCTVLESRNVKYHYATSHFIDKLEENICPDKRGCRICSKRFLSRLSLIRHLCSVHHIMENLIPLIENQPRRKTMLPDEYISKKDPANGLHGCNLCSKEFRTQRNLAFHMSLSHYKNDLKQYYGDKVRVIKADVKSLLTSKTDLFL
jgi:hypothetical protein